MVTAATELKDTCFLKKKKKLMTTAKKQRHYFADKRPSSQGYGFSSGIMYGCESWTVKKAER